MPWHVVQNHSECPSSRPWAVVKDGTDEVEGCHPSRETANDQLAALYAAEADQELQTMANDIVIQLGGKPNPGTPRDRRLHENADEKKCPEGQHLMPDGSCMPDEDMATDAEEFHGRHNQGSHGGGGGGGKKRGGPPKISPEASKHRLPSAGDVRDHKAAQRRENKAKKQEAIDNKRAANYRKARRRRGGPPPINPEADKMLLQEDDMEQFDELDELEDLELTGPLLAWEGILAVEGVETGDGREFATGSLEWPNTDDVILPLMWQEQSEPQHAKAIVVGRIEHVERLGEEIHGRGVIMANAKVTEQMRLGVAGGVSVDVDSVKDVDVEFIYDNEDEGAREEDSVIALFGPKPEKMIFHRGRLRGATLVALPAFVEAHLRLVDEESDGLVAAGVPVDPPTTWFDDPTLGGPTPWTVTEDGHVFGHLALWSTCHQTFIDRCITPPREGDFPYFMRRELKTQEGHIVGVGPITMDTGHADTRLGARPAAEHYDDTGAAVVDIAVGCDRYGIWVSGAMRPDLTALQVRKLRGASLSGDWRRIGGQLRLIAVLAVNVPGFPIPRMKARMDAEDTVALVAAGVVTDERIELVTHAERDLIEDTTIRVRRVV